MVLPYSVQLKDSNLLFSVKMIQETCFVQDLVEFELVDEDVHHLRD